MDFEESWEELNMLLREAMVDAPENRIVIASGDDLFNEHGESLYRVQLC